MYFTKQHNILDKSIIYFFSQMSRLYFRSVKPCCDLLQFEWGLYLKALGKRQDRKKAFLPLQLFSTFLDFIFLNKIMMHVLKAEQVRGVSWKGRPFSAFHAERETDIRITLLSRAKGAFS